MKPLFNCQDFQNVKLKQNKATNKDLRKKPNAFTQELASRVKKPGLKNVKHLLDERICKKFNSHNDLIRQLEQELNEKKTTLRQMVANFNTKNNSSLLLIIIYNALLIVIGECFFFVCFLLGV